MNKNRDKKGRYAYTGETNSNYFFGKNGHRAIWEAVNGKIPRGMTIHHKNGDRFDNRIENLECLTWEQHNKIHGHKPWNNRLTRKTSEKFNQAILKRMEVKKENYLKKCRETLSYYENGKTQKQTGLFFDISERQVWDRLRAAKIERENCTLTGLRTPCEVYS